MTAEQEFFLQIMSDHLAGEKTAPRLDVDWEALRQFAHAHQVEGVVFYQCRGFIPLSVYASFEKGYKIALYSNKNRESDYQAIDERFTAAGIRHFSVKGLEVASCFPLPALRTMGDLDIIVSKSNKVQAGKILASLGFEPSGEHAPDYDWGYDRNRLHYELHHQLIYDEVVTKATQSRFLNEYWNYVRAGKLDWSFHFLFLIAHLRKHMLNCGAGFRMFMDLAAVIQRAPGLNWPWIGERLDALGMKKFAEVCFALIEIWFGVKAQSSYPQLAEEFAETATEKIFANGAFGFHDERNKTNAAANGVLRYENKRALSRIATVLRYMFPKYKHMRYISAYRFVDGKPWLMPAAWAYRYVRLIKGAAGGVEQAVEKVTVSDEIVDDREAELRSWGLM